MSVNEPTIEASTSEHDGSKKKDVLTPRPETPSQIAFGIMERISAQGIDERKVQETKKIIATYQETRSVKAAFVEVARERTRADNIWCGINGVGIHMAEQAFFEHLLNQPNLTPDQILVYSHIRDQSSILKTSRDAIRRLLIADAATDPGLYDGSAGVQASQKVPLGLDSSRISRYLDAEITRRLLSSVQEISASQGLWQGIAEQQALVYAVSVPENLRKPIDDEFFNAGGNEMKKNIDDLVSLSAGAETLASTTDTEDANKRFLKIVGTATMAQGYLEHMHYYAGAMLLGKFEANGNQLTDEQRRALTPNRSK